MGCVCNGYISRSAAGVLRPARQSEWVSVGHLHWPREMSYGRKSLYLDVDKLPKVGKRFTLGRVLNNGMSAKVYQGVDRENGNWFPCSLFASIYHSSGFILASFNMWLPSITIRFVSSRRWNQLKDLKSIQNSRKSKYTELEIWRSQSASFSDCADIKYVNGIVSWFPRKTGSLLRKLWALCIEQVRFQLELICVERKNSLNSITIRIRITIHFNLRFPSLKGKTLLRMYIYTYIYMLLKVYLTSSR